MRGIAVGVLLGLVISSACMHKAPPPTPDPTPRILVNTLWVQIRDWRAEAGLPLDPPVTLTRQFPASVGVAVAKKLVCPDREAPTCSDICSLATNICDNAETICKIADELGKDDPTQEKCTSAKASCREAKQRCCNCNADPPDAAAESLPPAPVKSEAAP